MKLFPQQRHVSPFPFSTLAWALDKTVNDTRPIGVSTTSLCLLASSPFPAPPPPQSVSSSSEAHSPPPHLQASRPFWRSSQSLAGSAPLSTYLTRTPPSQPAHNSTLPAASGRLPITPAAHLQMGSPGFLTHLLPWRVTLGPTCASPPETTVPPAPTVHMLQP